VTPGQRDPRTSGFGPLSWLWWPVVFAGWSLAATVMAAEWVASGAQDPERLRRRDERRRARLEHDAGFLDHER
jgi:hypothetical protein